MAKYATDFPGLVQMIATIAEKEDNTTPAVREMLAIGTQLALTERVEAAVTALERIATAIEQQANKLNG